MKILREAKVEDICVLCGRAMEDHEVKKVYECPQVWKKED